VSGTKVMKLFGVCPLPIRRVLVAAW